jgi:two-component sensor histidine kinase
VDDKAIVIRTNARELSLNTEVAVPCGLIVHELVSNSLKHAFPNEREGEIRVDMYHKNSQYILTVADNGIGLPADFSPHTSKSLGFKLVLALANQLNGQLDFESHGGTRFSITFAEESVRV